jgi:hypothetical protein
MSMDAIREGFRNYFGDDGPELPDPPPPTGSVSGGGWTVRYVIHEDVPGEAALDFLAEYGHEPPVHGRVRGDGSTKTVATLLDHYVFNPALGDDEGAARARMEQHNRKFARELERVGLL